MSVYKPCMSVSVFKRMTDIQWLISSSAPNMLKCPKIGHFFISLGQTLGQKTICYVIYSINFLILNVWDILIITGKLKN